MYDRSVFADLDRVDVIYTDEDGNKIGAQTDHRSRADIEADAPRTLVFALSRVLSPRNADLDLTGMEYVFREEPPPSLRRALEAADCRVRIDKALMPRDQQPDDELVDRLAGEALEEIGRAMLARHDQPISRDGLEALEAELVPEREGFDDWPAERRYTALLELGAAAGVVIRATNEGEWVRDHHFGFVFPFTLETQKARSNLFGRALRYYEESPYDGPSILLSSVGEGPQDGLILPVLRRAGVGDRVDVPLFSRPLLKTDDEDVPHIYLVQDRPSSVAYLPHASIEDFDALLEASSTNLSKLTLTPERIEGDLPMYVLDGHFFAASKILDRRFLLGLAESLDCEMLLVAVPGQQLAVIAPMTGEEALIAGFVQLVQNAYEDVTDSLRLSPHVFVATPQQGVHGMLRVVQTNPEDN